MSFNSQESIVTDDELGRLLACERQEDVGVRVLSRERTDLEFKRTGDENAIAKSVKTIAAFANCIGGTFAFGVSDNPRRICGCDACPDEAHLQNLLVVTSHMIHG